MTDTIQARAFSKNTLTGLSDQDYYRKIDRFAGFPIQHSNQIV